MRILLVVLAASLAVVPARTAARVQAATLGAYTRDLAASDAATRVAAACALGAIGDPAATPALVNALKDPSAGVREQAAWALGAIGK